MILNSKQRRIHNVQRKIAIDAKTVAPRKKKSAYPDDIAAQLSDEGKWVFLHKDGRPYA